MEPRVLQAYYSALVESSDSSLALQTNYPYSQFMQDYANRGTLVSASSNMQSMRVQNLVQLCGYHFRQLLGIIIISIIIMC